MFVVMSEGTGTGEEIRVLIVDDDPQVVDLADEYLAHTDGQFSVVTETSAPAAVDLLAAGEEFDCIVSDYRMPRMDGLEFLAAVREVEGDVPFVLFTSHWEELFEESTPDGVTDLVRKDPRSGSYSELVTRISQIAGAGSGAEA